MIQKIEYGARKFNQDSYNHSDKYAKDLLKEKNFPFKEIDIEKEGISREDLFKLTGGRTIPQIIIDGEKIGGFTELQKLEQSGKLND